jgi:hypothetical protein
MKPLLNGHDIRRVLQIPKCPLIGEWVRPDASLPFLTDQLHLFLGFDMVNPRFILSPDRKGAEVAACAARRYKGGVRGVDKAVAAAAQTSESRNVESHFCSVHSREFR